MSHHLVVRVIAKLLIPFIILYALYVQFHGDFGPGGGFQAGVIFASAFVLYALVYGLEAAQKVLPETALRVGIALGLLIYGGTGVLAMILGGEFLNYSMLAHDSAHGQHYGIFAIEFGVGLTVASVMASIFFNFAGRGENLDDKEE